MLAVCLNNFAISFIKIIKLKIEPNEMNGKVLKIIIDMNTMTFRYYMNNEAQMEAVSIQKGTYYPFLIVQSPITTNRFKLK